MRSSPFGEWVNVYYDPKKTDNKSLLSLIRKNQCPRATLIEDKEKHVLNPIIAPGDPVQIQVKLEKPATLTGGKLPKGWTLASEKSLKKGLNIITLKTPKNTKQGEQSLVIKLSNNTKIDSKIDVVKQVGRH